MHIQSGIMYGTCSYLGEFWIKTRVNKSILFNLFRLYNNLSCKYWYFIPVAKSSLLEPQFADGKKSRVKVVERICLKKIASKTMRKQHRWESEDLNNWIYSLDRRKVIPVSLLEKKKVDRCHTGDDSPPKNCKNIFIEVKIKIWS